LAVLLLSFLFLFFSFPGFLQRIGVLVRQQAITPLLFFESSAGWLAG
jgi:hypothetical protein